MSPFDNVLKSLHDNNSYTHMPFIFSEKILLCAIGLINPKYPGRDWRIGYIDAEQNKFSLFKTGLPEGSIECSPTAYFDNTHNKIIVSFLASTPANPEYRMYMLSGNSWESMSTAMDYGIVSYHGFVNNKLFVTTRFQPNDDIHIIIQNRDNNYDVLVTMNQYVHKVSYLSQKEDTMIISLRKKENPYHAKEILVDTNDYSKVTIVKSKQNKLYKASIFNDFALYGEKLPGFDNRRINYADNLEFITEPLKYHIQKLPKLKT